MDELTYLTFDLWLGKVAEGYVAKIRDPYSREAKADFRRPFSESEIEGFWRGIGLAASERAKLYGGSLFEALFHGELLNCFRGSLDQADLEGKGLRILLRLTDVPELADLPWEYLFDASCGRFFALSWKTPVVRYLEQPTPLKTLAVRPPLKMLVMVASPSGYSPLNGEQEWSRLKEALGDLESQGSIELQRLNASTLPALQHQLRRSEAHIFHFIGHGEFDERSQQGVLIMEDDSGRGIPVSAEDLAVVLHDRAPRLVVLNACEGARASPLNPFSGVAQTLIRQGVPAVVAMQTEILDDFALTLAQELYGALADGYPVDACLAEARKVLAGRQCAAWGTPVLYLRAPDGRIFDREETPVAVEPRALEEVGSMSGSSGARSRLIWAGVVAALVFAVSLLVAYERLRESPIESETQPPEVEPQGGDRAAEVAETEASDPVAVESDAGSKRPDSEELAPSDAPGFGVRPSAPPVPPADRPVAVSWDRQQGVHRNERDGQYYVWIPEGSFRYGCSPGDDLCEDDEKPASNQEIEDGFWLGQTEVTVRAYKRFRDHASPLPPAPSFNADWQDEAQPMVNLSRAEASRFCEWAATRLPTEIEWEYAARAGERRALPKDLSKQAWFADRGARGANAVSQLEPNDFRLYDMLGNASEWVAPGPDQPVDSGILRGGSWLHDRRFLRFSFRLHEAPGERSEMYGFRCLAEAI